MKLKIYSLFLFQFMLATLSAQDTLSNNSWTLKSDLLSHLRGNQAITLAVDIPFSEERFHSFGVDIVYAEYFLNENNKPSIPSISLRKPSGALRYSFNQKLEKNSTGYFGGQFLIGTYAYRYERYFCTASQAVPDAELCRCTEFKKNEFDYRNIKVSIAGKFGLQWASDYFMMGIEGRFGSYLILLTGNRHFAEDILDCPEILNGEEPFEPSTYKENSNSYRVIGHNTAELSKTRVGLFGQLVLHFGYKF